MACIVRVYGAANGITPTPHDGRYVIAWNPHTEFGTLELTSTADPAQAYRFRDVFEVMAQWNTQSDVDPVRPDGKDNKPLTAIHVEILPE